MNQSPRFNTQVCLISGQATPNITPALASDMRPETVVLVVSDDTMAVRAEWLANILREHGITPHFRRLSSTEDFDKMQDDFRRIVKEFPEAALNATGGKKTMSLAAFDAFREVGRPVFYVETNNQICWLTPTYAQGPRLSAEMSLKELLYAYGQSVDEMHQAEQVKALEFCRVLFQQGAQWAEPTVSLQYLGESDTKQIISKTGRLSQEQENLLQLACKHHLVFRHGGHWSCNKQQASFLSGGWLEAYVCAFIQNMYPDLRVYRGVKVHATASPTVKNEMDVVFVKNNRLFIIECKALRPTSRSKSVTDFLYTLQSVRATGGLTAKAALLTWGAAPGPADTARATDNQIKIFAATALNQFQQSLPRWINGEHRSS